MIYFKLLLLLCLILNIFSSLVYEKIPHENYNILNPWDPMCPYDAHQKITQFSVDMSMYYSWFASYARCLDDVISEGKCCPGRFDSPYWTLFDHEFAEFNYKEENFQSNFVIFKSDEYKKYVISFPSTRGGFTQIIDEILHASLEPLDDPSNPIWIMDYTRLFLKKVQDKLFSDKNLAEFRAHPDYQIIWTGHSLGGSTSTLAAFYEQYYPNYSFKNNNKPVIVTFGQNRIGNGDFVDFMEPRFDIYRVLRKYDIVGIIPPCGLAILTSDYCQKVHDLHVHAGRYYLIDDNQEYIYYCDVEYVQPQDQRCLNPLNFADLDFRHHENYFEDENLSRRCTDNGGLNIY